MAASISDNSPLAYSYIRFSSPEQAKGDSLRRQTEAAADWCQRNHIALDTTVTLHDLGKSAFTGKHRENPDRHALAAFLKMVENGKVAHGSYLLIENLDRLSREDEVPACHLLTGILMAGVKVVQLSPYEMQLTDKSNGWELMRAVMELSRGHGESAIKSERIGGAWHAKRAAARAGQEMPPRRKDGRRTRAITNHLPAWIRDKGGILELIPGRALTVQKIFALAADGYGTALIIQELCRGKHKKGWTGKGWNRCYVSMILKDRRAVGEFQPRYADGRPAGDPIANYFPPCVTEAQWLAVLAARAGRKNPRGRVGKHVNLFSGLLHNAREGDAYYIQTRTNNGKHRRVLLSKRACDNGEGACSFPEDALEWSVLAKLKEIDPKTVLGDAPGQEGVRLKAGELAHVRGRLAELQVVLERTSSPTYEKAVLTLEKQEKKLNDQLAELRRQAAHPAGEAWGEAMTLVDVLATAPDPKETRLKLRSLLRQLVEAIWVLVVPRGRDRLAAVQLFFRGDGHRSYLIWHTPPKANGKDWRVEGVWPPRVKSFAAALGKGDFDLRDRGDVAALEQDLAAIDLATLADAPDGH
jgi:DNA invertase Pin-like site-specific DNA recombinase